MWTAFIVTAAAILAAAWIPVGAHFWKAWRNRGAPLSLAICGLVAFQIYANVSVWLFIQNDSRWVASVMSIGNFLILSNFYLCFKWQRSRFPDARQEPLDWRKSKNGKSERPLPDEDDTDPDMRNPMS